MFHGKNTLDYPFKLTYLLVCVRVCVFLCVQVHLNVHVHVAGASGGQRVTQGIFLNHFSIFVCPCVGVCVCTCMCVCVCVSADVQMAWHTYGGQRTTLDAGLWLPPWLRQSTCCFSSVHTKLADPGASRDFLVSTFPVTIELGSYCLLPHLALCGFWVFELILVFAQQALHPQSHLPSTLKR